MKSYIPVTFLFMAVAFYEMSGGNDFTPAVALAEPTLPAPVEVVTRAETSTVASLVQVPLIAPAPEAVTEVAMTPPAAATPPAAPAPESTAETIEVAVAEPEPIDLRAVTGRSVNMRAGPGKNYAVIDQLLRGDTVEVLEAADNGWVRLRLPETGLEGWMSASYLASIEI